jgi:hypothetical protein
VALLADEDSAIVPVSKASKIGDSCAELMLLPTSADCVGKIRSYNNGSTRDDKPSAN